MGLRYLKGLFIQVSLCGLWLGLHPTSNLGRKTCRFWGRFWVVVEDSFGIAAQVGDELGGGFGDGTGAETQHPVEAGGEATGGKADSGPAAGQVAGVVSPGLIQAPSAAAHMRNDGGA